MRSQLLSGVVGGLLVGAAWLTGACGSSFVADGSGGAGGIAATSGAGSLLSGRGGQASQGHAGHDSGVSGAAIIGEDGMSADAGAGGAPEARNGGLDGGGTGGASLAGAGGMSAGAGGLSAGAGGLSAGGTSGAGAGGAGAAGAGAGGAGAGGAPSCMPSVASWAGCQSGTCGACSTAVSAYPLYFKNHASCPALASCSATYSACSAACPAPAATDQCDGSVGQWSGCRGSGCYVCVELVSSYPKYFEHHPNCAKNTTCQNSYFTCSAACPAPTDTDK